ncbi:hypothetical protein VXR09_05280 [Acinetobacter baumannii]|uniref:hypothetical protein n=1 Tax=Acinetobacter baumannii TaxID=470 RepID=UPI000A3505E4|nr:hypothetical protein [Acinetobacter baumannii]MDC5087283.1 hypothetical protein [Acinetobacter baumannii]MDH2495637.1 hypothetical protein [Acinetobacter baumannii]MDQ8961758.1 hypothetical protein [Acinetobacter baumannii]OTK50428.1 hypothetical protein B9X70_09900 [Acinetobacter baumannii]OTM34003.1 hypothetical protein B9X47_11945 [Acinetobacter baumannii]
MNQVIKEITDSLINLYMFKGIQPSELADSIFEDCYLGMTTKKSANNIEVVISFTEVCEITSKMFTHHMKYVYNKESFLLKIEEAINSKGYKPVWDRASLVKYKIEALSEKLKESAYKEAQIKEILNTIPPKFKQDIQTELKLVC